MKPRRPKQHKILYTFIDQRNHTSTDYYTINGRFTMELPPYVYSGPDGKDWEFNPEQRLESIYVGYSQPINLTLRERFADAWDAFRGKELPQQHMIPPKPVFGLDDLKPILIPKETTDGPMSYDRIKEAYENHIHGRPL